MRATFTVTDWNEELVDETAPRITRVRARKAFEGDVVGTSTIAYQLVYGDDGTAVTLGVERLDATIGDRSGTLVLQHVGRFADGAATADITVVADYGTGDFAGVGGAGSMRADPSGAMDLDLFGAGVDEARRDDRPQLGLRPPAAPGATGFEDRETYARPTRANASMPAGEIIPVLAYRDVADAVRWLTECFGFGVRWTAGSHRAQLAIGESAVAITPKPADVGALHPGWVTSLMVRIDGIDRFVDRACRLGAHAMDEPTTFPYGERQCTLLDVEGNPWTFSETVADVNPTHWGARSDADR
jgi:uncharacterized glyoxalase superfamily protein PhnB